MAKSIDETILGILTRTTPEEYGAAAIAHVHQTMDTLQTNHLEIETSMGKTIFDRDDAGKIFMSNNGKDIPEEKIMSTIYETDSQIKTAYEKSQKTKATAKKVLKTNITSTIRAAERQVKATEQMMTSIFSALIKQAAKAQQISR